MAHPHLIRRPASSSDAFAGQTRPLFPLASLACRPCFGSVGECGLVAGGRVAPRLPGCTRPAWPVNCSRLVPSCSCALRLHACLALPCHAMPAFARRFARLCLTSRPRCSLPSTLRLVYQPMLRMRTLNPDCGDIRPPAPVTVSTRWRTANRDSHPPAKHKRRHSLRSSHDDHSDHTPGPPQRNLEKVAAAFGKVRQLPPIRLRLV